MPGVSHRKPVAGLSRMYAHSSTSNVALGTAEGVAMGALGGSGMNGIGEGGGEMGGSDGGGDGFGGGEKGGGKGGGGGLGGRLGGEGGGLGGGGLGGGLLGSQHQPTCSLVLAIHRSCVMVWRASPCRHSYPVRLQLRLRWWWRPLGMLKAHAKEPGIAPGTKSADGGHLRPVSGGASIHS